VDEIKSRSDSSKAPALIYHDLNVVERVLRDQVSSDFSAIWSTPSRNTNAFCACESFPARPVRRVKLYTKETPSTISSV